MARDCQSLKAIVFVLLLCGACSGRPSTGDEGENCDLASAYDLLSTSETRLSFAACRDARVGELLRADRRLGLYYVAPGAPIFEFSSQRGISYAFVKLSHDENGLVSPALVRVDYQELISTSSGHQMRIVVVSRGDMDRMFGRDYVIMTPYVGCVKDHSRCVGVAALVSSDALGNAPSRRYFVRRMAYLYLAQGVTDLVPPVYGCDVRVSQALTAMAMQTVCHAEDSTRLVSELDRLLQYEWMEVLGRLQCVAGGHGDSRTSIELVADSLRHMQMCISYEGGGD